MSSLSPLNNVHTSFSNHQSVIHASQSWGARSLRALTASTSSLLSSIGSVANRALGALSFSSSEDEERLPLTERTTVVENSEASPPAISTSPKASSSLTKRILRAARILFNYEEVSEKRVIRKDSRRGAHPKQKIPLKPQESTSLHVSKTANPHVIRSPKYMSKQKPKIRTASPNSSP